MSDGTTTDNSRFDLSFPADTAETDSPLNTALLVYTWPVQIRSERNLSRLSGDVSKAPSIIWTALR